LPQDRVPPDLVTATALFDLVSAAWLERFLDALAAQSLPLYAALSYDGEMRWEPAHPLDGAVTGAFNRHQRTEKGFGGPALGPDAPQVMRAGLEARGYKVLAASTPWRIDADQAALLSALIDGIAGAVPEGTIWRAARQQETRAGYVGHSDLLAFPA
jgi:hypothetical protein